MARNGGDKIVKDARALPLADPLPAIDRAFPPFRPSLLPSLLTFEEWYAGLHPTLLHPLVRSRPLAAGETSQVPGRALASGAG